MSKRNLFRLVLLLGAAAYFGYSQFQARAHNGRAAAPAGVAIAVNAKSFTLGKLEFSACELAQKRSGATTAAFCAPFSVAENPDKPDARKIDLKVAMIKSEAERADSDIVVFFAGGPGQAAVDTYPQIAGALAPLRKHHHILLLDQRGTGTSHALDCKATADAGDAKAADSGEQIEREETTIGFDAQKFRDATAKCLAEVEKHADPRQYTTTVAAQDLEDLRQALG